MDRLGGPGYRRRRARCGWTARVTIRSYSRIARQSRSGNLSGISVDHHPCLSVTPGGACTATTAGMRPGARATMAMDAKMLSLCGDNASQVVPLHLLPMSGTLRHFAQQERSAVTDRGQSQSCPAGDRRCACPARGYPRRVRADRHPVLRQSVSRTLRPHAPPTLPPNSRVGSQCRCSQQFRAIQQHRVRHRKAELRFTQLSENLVLIAGASSPARIAACSLFHFDLDVARLAIGDVHSWPPSTITSAFTDSPVRAGTPPIVRCRCGRQSRHHSPIALA